MGKYEDLYHQLDVVERDLRAIRRAGTDGLDDVEAGALSVVADRVAKRARHIADGLAIVSEDHRFDAADTAST